jgi:hypothetical protein
MHSSTSSSETWAANLTAVRRFSVTVAVLAVAAFAVGELLLRLAGVSYFNFGTPDIDLGWGNRPYAEGWFRKENPAGVYIRINSYGANDREHTAAKDPDVFRVAVLGNSYTEAFHVPNEQAYWNVMGQQMRRCLPPGKRRIEVLNFGVSGYGTAQSLIQLEKKVWAFQPDLVVLGFLTGSDVWYNHRQLQKMDQAPYFVLRDGKLVLDDAFQSMIYMGLGRRIQFAVERHVRMVQWLTNSRSWFRQMQFDILQTARGADVGKQAESLVKPTDMIYRMPDTTETGRIWAEAWEVTEALLVEMAASCRRHGAEFQLVTLTNPAQVHPETQRREQLARAIGVEDLFYPDRRLAAFGQKAGIPVITLAPELSARASQEKVFLHGFPDGELGAGHWNETGNRWVGESIGRQWCKRNGVGPQP